ncbi:uncharacterized protein LOC143293874 [Babylonia areolata]|uniref:uncharacterized protein LOC143293874 n=1 Tax=Babylonia areolata TaxID=304850 RepID=UPI003FD4295A
MALSNIVKKASNLLRLSGSDSPKPPPLDGEIIYCKNNVCVHPPASLLVDSEHHPGYLTLRAHQSEGTRPTLILTWIPNLTLQKNPQSIENSPNKSHGTTPKASPRRTPRQEFAKAELSPSPNQKSSWPKQQGATTEQKKQSQDAWSLSSDMSCESREEAASPTSSTPGDDSWRAERKLSSSAKSQTDSGIGTEEPVVLTGMTLNSQMRKLSDTVMPALPENSNSGGESSNGEGQQNNTKHVTATQKQVRVGINVNDLNAGADASHADNCDVLTAEEQLAAMLNRPKLQAKRRSGESVGEGEDGAFSIHMAGDSLVVMSEGQTAPEGPSSITDKNINTNDSKFDTSTASSSQSTDNDSPGVGTSSQYALSSPSTQQASPESSSFSTPVNNLTPQQHSSPHFSPAKRAVGVLSKPPCLLELPGTTPPPPNTPVDTPDIAVTRPRSASSSTTTTSGPDSPPLTPVTSDAEEWEAACQGVGEWSGHYSLQQQDGDEARQDSQHSSALESPDSTTSSASVTHNMTFPENSMSFNQGKRERRSARDQVCGVFSVDLGQMRSLRLFYSDSACSTGQVVIASRESQYKILHFHNGGLDRLAEIFQEWSLFAQETDKSTMKVFKSKDALSGGGGGGEDGGCKPYQQFLVVKPQLTNDDCHPEEGQFLTVTEDIWKEHMNSDGTVEDELQLRKAIFFGGLDPMIRPEVWPFLLHYFPFDSTFEEREQIRNDKYIEYHQIRKMRESLRGEEKQHFWRNIQCIVEKDVVRTDRSHPYFRGQHNPNIQVLKNILLNFAASHPHSGYSQGMSDLLAPILAETQQEADAYWCFSGLMNRTIFVSSPTDSDMDKQLDYLRELLRVMLPRFFYHLKLLGQDALEMLFAHRWILLCFKREFNEQDALRIWETCWAHYQTDYFHLFLCVAIVAIYGDDVVDQRLPADDILLHFSSLAMHMNVDIVLRKARGLLHQFRSKAVIPCTLMGLCAQCDPGMWDSGHVPTVECITHLHNKICPATRMGERN